VLADTLSYELMEQSFTAGMPLVTATSTFGLGKK